MTGAPDGAAGLGEGRAGGATLAEAQSGRPRRSPTASISFNGQDWFYAADPFAVESSDVSAASDEGDRDVLSFGQHSGRTFEEVLVPLGVASRGAVRRPGPLSGLAAVAGMGQWPRRLASRVRPATRPRGAC